MPNERKSFYERGRDFLARRTENEDNLLKAYLDQASKDYRNPMGYGSIFSNKNNVYREIPQMLQDPIIASCVAVTMETAFQPTADDSIVRVTSPYKKVAEELEDFHREYEIDSAILTAGYNVLVYGNVPIKIDLGVGLKFNRYQFMPNFTEVIPVIVSNRTLGYLYNGEFYDPFEFVYAQHLYYRDLGGTTKKTTKDTAGGTTGVDGRHPKIENEFVIAPSYLSPAVRPWRNIKVIEDSLLLQRLDVSNFMRIIGVKVGDNVFNKQAVRLLNFYRQLFKKVRRVSYDGDGMSSSSFGNDFEVIVPYTESQGLDIKDIGGQVDVRALRDLEVQYKRLFSSLRIQPSFIGFSEETSPLNSDGATQRWDERFARLVKALRLSVTKAIKKIDVIYLRSKGYDISESDFDFTYLAASTVEDDERKNTLKNYVGAIAEINSALASTGVAYNRDYLVKELFSSALSSTSVDIEKLFSEDDQVSEIQPIASSCLRDDQKKAYKEYVKIGILSEAELKLTKTSKQRITSDNAQIEDLPEISYERFLALGDVLARGRNVNLDPIVESTAVDTGVFKKAAKDTVVAPLRKICTGSALVSAENLSSGTIAAIENLYLVDDGYYLAGEDLYNYLYMLDQGIKGIPVKTLWKKD